MYILRLDEFDLARLNSGHLWCELEEEISVVTALLEREVKFSAIIVADAHHIGLIVISELNILTKE